MGNAPLRPVSVVVIGLVVSLVAVMGGCSRRFYRGRADEAAYQLIGSRLIDSRWDLPMREVEPDPRSRNGLFIDPDCRVLPCDDPAAHRWMRHPYRFHNHKNWDKLPRTAEVENPVWLDYLPWDEHGRLGLSLGLAMDLALIHSREFQGQYEQVYLNALALTGNRFEFDTQWAGGVGADFTATGDGATASRLLDVTDRLGFERQLATGGQFATNIVNSFIFELGPGGFHQAGGALVATFTQPLLRGAGRHIRLESLTQAERDLLYQVRDFARFRREFYFEVVSRYYGLLAQVQSIRNLKANLESLTLNLQEHEELFERKMVAQIQVDQVFQDYQAGRINLFSAEQALANTLDSFKFLLGLPPWIEIELDESPLESFEFASAEILQLDLQIQALYADMLNYLPPDDTADRNTIATWLTTTSRLAAEVKAQFPLIRTEFERWSAGLDQRMNARLSTDDRFDVILQKRVRDDLLSRLEDLGSAIEVWDSSPWRESLMRLAEHGDLADAWRQLLERVSRELQEQVNDLYLAQSQVRLFSIDLETVSLEAPVAVEFAHHNRLDIMNSRARTVDAFRRVEISANALRSQLDVTGQVALGTDPTRDNAFRFDSSANSYRMGVRLDGPLNRLNERNAFRASEIAYQQARRQLLATEDAVSAAIRADLRALDISKLNFQIARQQYIAVTRQVDEAKFNLRTSNQANSNLTRDLLTSLQGLLAAKNNLISNWFDYKTAKIRLFVDLELLYLDEQGKWINEETGLEMLEQFRAPADHTVPLNHSEQSDRNHGDGAIEPHSTREELGVGKLSSQHRELSCSRPQERLIWQSGFGELDPGCCWWRFA